MAITFFTTFTGASGVTIVALGGLLMELRRMTGGIPGASEASLLEHQEIFTALERRDAAFREQVHEAMETRPADLGALLAGNDTWTVT